MHRYFDDLQFMGADELPDCHYQLEYRHPEWVVLNCVLSGAIHFCESGHKRLLLQGPACFWTLPGRTYVYGNVPEAHWHQLWVSARGPRVERMLESGLIPTEGVPVQRIRSDSAFAPALRELCTIVMEDRAHEQATAVHRWEQLFELIHLERGRAGRASHPARQAIESLAATLQAEPQRDWQMQEEAQRLGMSYHHFRRTFQSLLGSAPHDYLLKCRIHLAAQLLRSEAASVQEVAERCGYENFYYFSRLFKKKMGMSPRAYRKSLPIIR